jgi:hypothetical protein
MSTLPLPATRLAGEAVAFVVAATSNRREATERPGRVDVTRRSGVSIATELSAPLNRSAILVGSRRRQFETSAR